MTYSIYNLRVENSLSFLPGITAGWILSINTDGSTRWINSGGMGSTGPQGFQGILGPQGFQGITGTFSGQSIQRMSGSFSGSLLSGSPLSYTVVLPASFSAPYIISIESDMPRNYTVDVKSSSGFVLNTNSITPFSDVIYWEANQVANISYGAIGSTGPQGSGTGQSTNKTTLTLPDSANISWTYSISYNAKVSITSNRNLFIIGATNGDYGTLEIVHTSGNTRILFTGSIPHIFPYGTYSFGTGTGSVDVFTFFHDGDRYLWTYNNNFS